MKTIKKSVLLIAILIIAVFVSCSGDPKGSNDSSSNSSSGPITSSARIFGDLSGLRNFKADIGASTAAVGIADRSSFNDSSSRSLDEYLEYLIVKVDEGSSQATPVTFTATDDAVLDGRNIKAGDVISQEEFLGTVDKVYVLGDYTLVSFLTFDALALINRVETQVRTEEWGEYYSGNIEFRQENGNNGGWNEWISYYYQKNYNNNNDSSFNINYSKNTWWNDSNGNYHNERVERNENLALRCAYNNKPAAGELDGVKVYDTFDYYTSDFRQSFIIDNNTGLIYMIPKQEGSDGLKLSVLRGIVIDRNLGPVKLTVDENDELKLTQILENPDIFVVDAFKDENDQYYILTDSYSEKDYEEGIVFFNVPGEYVPTQDGKVLHFTYGNTSVNNGYLVNDVKLVDRNLSERAFSSDISINYYYPYDNYYNSMNRGLREYNQRNGHDIWNVFNNTTSGSKDKFTSIKDGVLYHYYCYSDSIQCQAFNIATGRTDYVNIPGWNTGLRFAVLDDNYIIVAEKNDNNKHTLSAVDPFETYFNNCSRCYYSSDGTYHNIANTQYEIVWDYAFENNLVVPFKDAYPSGSFPWNCGLDSNHYYSRYDEGTGNYIYYVFAQGYNYSTVLNLYNSSSSPRITVMENVSISNWSGYHDAFTMDFTVTKRTGTDTYRIVKTGAGQYEAVLASSTLAQTKTITLQPINK